MPSWSSSAVEATPYRVFCDAVRAIRMQQLIAYFGVSLVALALDYATLVVLVEVIRLNSALAAVVGYTLGAVLAYCGCMLFVVDRKAPRAGASGFIVFVSLSAVGLLITWSIMWAGGYFSVADYRLVKSAAAAASFLSNYGARKLFLFG